jgi:hypothetical protein
MDLKRLGPPHAELICVKGGGYRDTTKHSEGRPVDLERLGPPHAEPGGMRGRGKETSQRQDLECHKRHRVTTSLLTARSALGP